MWTILQAHSLGFHVGHWSWPHGLHDEEQVKSRHDRRAQIAVLMQRQGRPRHHEFCTGDLLTNWHQATTDSLSTKALIVGVLWQHGCQNGTTCLKRRLKLEAITVTYEYQRFLPQAARVCWTCVAVPNFSVCYVSCVQSSCLWIDIQPSLVCCINAMLVRGVTVLIIPLDIGPNSNPSFRGLACQLLASSAGL